MWFRHKRPASHAVQERFFRAPLRYERDTDAMLLSREDLQLPLRSADPGLLPILLRHAAECLARLPRVDDFRGEVRRVVIDGLSSGAVGIDDVATRLGMSARSVQRRLQEHDQSFSELVAEARLAMARRYLEDASISLTEAAFLLGYSDLSAFSRAFRRWTGQSALSFRRERLENEG